MPQVSVLVPMKNAAAYVAEAITSILGQDFKDLELIVVDDGSTDGSRAEVAKFAGDSRLKIIDGPRRGISAAWNAAFAVSTGAIIMRCDADDAYPPGRLSRQLALLERLPEFGAVCASFCSIDRQGRKLRDFQRDAPAAGEITQTLLDGTVGTSLCTFAIRREPLVAVGGKREFFETAEDLDLQLRLAEVCRIWFQPDMEYLYRIHGESITHRQAGRRRDFFEAYARELRAQRALPGGLDDLQRGQPRQPPVEQSRPYLASEHAQGYLISEAWRAHREGARISALQLGVRALAEHPASLTAWKNLAALALKPTRS